MSELRHDMEPVWVDDPKRPMDWDAYVWQAGAWCRRCKKSLIAEYWIPRAVLDLIPAEKRDEAMRRMGDFAKRKLAAIVELQADPERPECEPR